MQAGAKSNADGHFSGITGRPDMAEKVHGNGQVRPEQVAIYVADLARQLKQMAERHDMPELAYLLDLVRAEAELKSRPEPRPHA